MQIKIDFSNFADAIVQFSRFLNWNANTTKQNSSIQLMGSINF